MGEARRPRRPDADAIPAMLTGLGVAFGVTVVVEWGVFGGFRPEMILASRFLVGLATSGPFMLLVGLGGYWLRRSDLPPERYPRVAGWCVGGLAAFVGMNALIIVTMPPETVAVLVGWLRWAATIGAGVGLPVGVIEARAIERARTAERAAARADYAEARREELDYLNSLLRHEVLNAANVIDGLSQRVLADHDLPEAARDDIEGIGRRSREVASVVTDARLLLEASSGDADREAVDLTAVLTESATVVREEHDGVEVSVAAPEGVTVLADDLLPRLFGNLLANAIEHNDGDRPRVDVTVETTPDTALVRVSDNGPGIPPSERETLFDRDASGPTDHGLGLYLVATLAERYDGTVELADTGPDGTTFTVELPLAGPGPGNDHPQAVAAK